MRIDGILLIFIIISSLSLCGAATAHPGHGTPIEEPSDPDTSTDPGSSGTTSSGSSQSSSSSGSTSTSSRSSDSTAGVTQSDETGTVDTQTTDTTAAQTGNSPEKTYETSGSSNSAGGPVAMIGLMVVIGLIAMSFPYNEGGTLRSIQMSFFSR
jgi:cobalamin biosynthesis Mg chelatase CobN